MSLPKDSITPYPVVPGIHKATHFIMDGNPASYAFLVEKIETDLFELTIFTIDHDGDRTEYVIHCPSQGLTLLAQGIATTLYQHSQVKERIHKD